MNCSDCGKPRERLIPYTNRGHAVCPACWKTYNYWPFMWGKLLGGHRWETETETIARLRRA